MNKLKEYCISEEQGQNPNFVEIYKYSMDFKKDIKYFNIVLIPQIDPVTGHLSLVDPNGSIIKTLTINTNDYFPSLMAYLHCAIVYNGPIVFCVYSNTIGVFLNVEKHVCGLYLPCITHFDNKSISGNITATKNTATNEKDAELNSLFNLQLYNYQINNIKWMINLENLGDSNIIRYPDLLSQNLIRIELTNAEFYYNPQTRFLYPVTHEENIPHFTRKLRGGILADAVGLGKTFTVYALILNTLDRQINFYAKKPTRYQLLKDADPNKIIPDEEEKCKYSSTSTLIIIPSRLVGQWKEELQKIMIPNHDLRVYAITSIVEFRALNISKICNADIVLLSDRFLNNIKYLEHISNGGYTLHDFNWKRIIIDEGHEYLHSGNSVINICRIIKNFNSKFRWICSGTPFAQNLDSLDQYLSFLTCREYALADFKNFDGNELEKFLNLNVRQNTFESIKAQVQIPKIIQKTILLKQDPVERALYVNATGHTTRMIQLCTNILVSDADSSIINGVTTTLDAVRERMIKYYEDEYNKYELALEHCKENYEKESRLYENAETILTKGSEEWKTYRSMHKTASNEWKQRIETNKALINSMKSRKQLFDNVYKRAESEPCVICTEEMHDIVLTKCSHIFCRDCMQLVIRNNPSNIYCPMCRTELNNTTDIGYFIKNVETKEMNDYQIHVQKWGTKMAWLIKYMKRIFAQGARVIVFSQWKIMLTLVGQVFDENEISHVYLKGTSSQMGKAMQSFKNGDKRVIMLSSETCSSGSNLTEATHIILLDTVNAESSAAKAIEEQAIGRASRLGQDKQVKVIRLIMENTIEHDYYNANIPVDDIEILKDDKIFLMD